MYIVTLIAVIAFLLTVFDSKGILNSGMKIGFVLVTIIGAIHYNYGNDYIPYYEEFKYINSFSVSFSDLISGTYFRDPGWAVLNKIFGVFDNGFFILVAVLTIIQNVIIYRFIKQNVTKEWWPLAVFIFLFNNTFYLLSFSMLRQWFVICVFAGLWPYIRDRKWWVSFIVLFLCTFIHSSSYVLLPMSFAGYLKSFKGRCIAIISVVIFVTLWASQSLLLSISARFLNLSILSDYKIYEGGSLDSIGIGYILNLLPFIISIIYLFKDKGDNNLLVLLSIIPHILVPFQQILHLMSRIGMYFSIYSIIAYPLVYRSINNLIIRRFLIAILIFMTLLSYYGFFNSETFGEYYRNYSTIFSSKSY